jgi:hypothetical protein
MGSAEDHVKSSSRPGSPGERVIRDVGLMFFGNRTHITRHGPAGETQFHLWCQAEDHGGYFTATADIRPGDLVTIKLNQGGTAQRVVDTISEALNGRTWARWRIPSGAPHALSLTDLHPAVRTAAEQLYRDGHYARAVAEAFKAIELSVRERVPTAARGLARWARPSPTRAPSMFAATLGRRVPTSSRAFVTCSWVLPVHCGTLGCTRWSMTTHSPPLNTSQSRVCCCAGSTPPTLVNPPRRTLRRKRSSPRLVPAYADA